MRAEITKSQLKALLIEAQEEHHEYEKRLDDTDDNWADWYAEFMFSRLEEVHGAEGTNASSGSDE